MSTRISPSLWERGRVIRCEIFASDHSDENAVGVRDHEERDALVTHPLRDCVASRARSDGARPERHRVFGACALAGAQRLSADQSQDDASSLVTTQICHCLQRVLRQRGRARRADTREHPRE